VNPSTTPEVPGSAGTERSDLRLVVASSIVGTTVEWYDFFLYGTAAGIVFNQLFFPAEDPAVGTLLSLATFAIGFLARPVGGLIFGHLGDRVGRKKTLVATMMIMGVATCAIGVVPDYATIGVAAPALLVILRLFQGIAIGGEWGGAVLMAVEYAPRRRAGLYGSFPQIGLAIGLMLGTGVFAVLGATMSESAFMAWGWRIAFLLSAILVLIGLVIRLKVMETPAFRKLEETEQKATVPAADLVRSPVGRRNLWLGMAARLTEGTAFNCWAVFALSYGTATLNLPRQPLLIAVMVAAAVMVVVIPVCGRLSDSFRRRRTYTLGAVLTALMAVPAFLALQGGQTVWIVMAMVGVLGIAYPVMYAPEAAFFAELFAPAVRCTGISLVYQLSGVVASGLAPLVLAYLVAVAHGGIGLVLPYLGVVTVISVLGTVWVRREHLYTDAPAAVAEPALDPSRV
jgi:metabolite-proton symporter